MSSPPYFFFASQAVFGVKGGVAAAAAAAVREPSERRNWWRRCTCTLNDIRDNEYKNEDENKKIKTRYIEHCSKLAGRDEL